MPKLLGSKNLRAEFAKTQPHRGKKNAPQGRRGRSGIASREREEALLEKGGSLYPAILLKELLVTRTFAPQEGWARILRDRARISQAYVDRRSRENDIAGEREPQIQAACGKNFSQMKGSIIWRGKVNRAIEYHKRNLLEKGRR